MSSIDSLLHSFCLRGFREKVLFKALQKNKDILSRLFEPNTLKECSVSFEDLLKQLDCNQSSKSGNVAKSPGEEVEKMETGDEGKESEKSDDRTGHKKGNVKLDLPGVDGSKESTPSKVGGKGLKDAKDEAGGNNGSSSKSSTSDSSSSSSSGSTSPIEQAHKKDPSTTQDADDDKSDSDDNSSDSDSSSSSASSSHDDDDEDEEEKEVVGVALKKPRLSSANSMRESVSTFHQMSISLRHAHKVPETGVFDPEFPELIDQYALKVLEYLEEVSERLATAQLQNEVRGFILVCVCVCPNF